MWIKINKIVLPEKIPKLSQDFLDYVDEHSMSYNKPDTFKLDMIFPCVRPVNLSKFYPLCNIEFLFALKQMKRIWVNVQFVNMSDDDYNLFIKGKGKRCLAHL